MADIKSANKKTDQNEPEANAWALLPVLVFILVFAVLSIIVFCYPDAQEIFNKVPIAPAFVISLIFAMQQNKKISFTDKLSVIGRGIGNSSIIYMILIFILAGLFAGTVGRSSASSIAYFMLNFIPSQYCVLVLFLVSCIISLSMGTSVGSITLMIPIAVSVSNASGQNLPVCAACVISGSMFGDNLSMISDTCIAACAGIGCKPKEKFCENIKMVVPAAIITIVFILVFTTNSGNELQFNESYQLLDFIPYILVFILGMFSINVCVVLALGIISGIGIMFLVYKVSISELINNMSCGITSMYEIIFITIIVAAITQIIKENGGFVFLLNVFNKVCKTKKGVQLSTGLMVGFVNMITANNTVAIVVSAPIAKEISKKYHIQRRLMASITDTFSCIVQGLLPYGAQMLIAIGLCNDAGQSINAFDIIPACWYQYILLIVVLFFIITGLSDKVNSNFSKENI